MGPAKRRPRRSPLEDKLARFEAMDPATLTDEEQRYRRLAISALRIELQLRARGLIDKAGNPVDTTSAKPATSPRVRRPRSK